MWRASLVAQMVKKCGRPGFNPGVRKIPWRRAWLPTPVFLPGEFHGQRCLADYSPWGPEELDTTEWLTLSLFMFSWDVYHNRLVTDMRIQLCSIKPDIKNFCKKHKTMPPFSPILFCFRKKQLFFIKQCCLWPSSKCLLYYTAIYKLLLSLMRTNWCYKEGTIKSWHFTSFLKMRNFLIYTKNFVNDNMEWVYYYLK